MRKNIIDENFVNELCKDGVWDVARVNLGSVNESSDISARDLAEELFENLSDDVIYECIDILHSTLLNEEDDLDEDFPGIHESFYDLLYAIDDSYVAIDEDYNISEATEGDIFDAIADSLDIDDLLESYTEEEIGGCIDFYLDESSRRRKAEVKAKLKAAGYKDVTRHGEPRTEKNNSGKWGGEFLASVGGGTRKEAREKRRRGQKYYSKSDTRKRDIDLKSQYDDREKKYTPGTETRAEGERKTKHPMHRGGLAREVAGRKVVRGSYQSAIRKSDAPRAKKANESTINEEERYQLLEDFIQDMNDTELDALIAEAIAVLEEDYDLSESTEEEVTEAVIEGIISGLSRVAGGVAQTGDNVKQSYQQGKEMSKQKAASKRDVVGTKHGSNIHKIQRKGQEARLKQDSANIKGERGLDKLKTTLGDKLRKDKDKGKDMGDEYERRTAGVIGGYGKTHS